MTSFPRSASPRAGIRAFPRAHLGARAGFPRRCAMQSAAKLHPALEKFQTEADLREARAEQMEDRLRRAPCSREADDRARAMDVRDACVRGIPLAAPMTH